MLWTRQLCSPHWDTWYWCSGFARKASLSTIFLIIKIHQSNETNLDTHNNLYSFCYGHYNHLLLIRIHDIDALDLQEKLLPFLLPSKFIHQMRQTWILIIVSILFVIGTAIMFSTLGYTILILWIYKKSFSLHHFPCNQSLSVK